MLPSTKKEARLSGSKLYFTGIQCCRGHSAARYVSSGHCIECASLHIKQWGVENADRKRDLWRKWFGDNREHRLEYKRGRNTEAKPETKKRWAENNREKILAAYRRYYRKNKQQRLLLNKVRVARTRSSGGRFGARDLRNILAAQGGRCAYCRANLSAGFHADHIVPLALGGSNDRSNIQALCASCNLRKSAKSPEGFAREIGLLI